MREQPKNHNRRTSATDRLGMSRGVWTPLHSESLRQLLLTNERFTCPIELIDIIESYIPFQLLKPIASNCDFLQWYDRPTVYYIFAMIDTYLPCLVNNINSDSSLIIFRFYDTTDQVSQFGSDLLNISLFIIGYIISIVLTISNRISHEINSIIISIISILFLIFLIKRILMTKYSKLLINTSTNVCILKRQTIVLKDYCNCNICCCCKENKNNIQTFRIKQNCQLILEHTEIRLYYDTQNKSNHRQSNKGVTTLLPFQRRVVPFQIRQNQSIAKMNNIIEEWIDEKKLIA